MAGVVREVWCATERGGEEGEEEEERTAGSASEGAAEKVCPGDGRLLCSHLAF